MAIRILPYPLIYWAPITAARAASLSNNKTIKFRVIRYLNFNYSNTRKGLAHELLKVLLTNHFKTDAINFQSIQKIIERSKQEDDKESYDKAIGLGQNIACHLAASAIKDDTSRNELWALLHGQTWFEGIEKISVESTRCNVFQSSLSMYKYLCNANADNFSAEAQKEIQGTKQLFQKILIAKLCINQNMNLCRHDISSFSNCLEIPAFEAYLEAAETILNKLSKDPENALPKKREHAFDLMLEFYRSNPMFNFEEAIGVPFQLQKMECAYHELGGKRQLIDGNTVVRKPPRPSIYERTIARARAIGLDPRTN